MEFQPGWVHRRFSTMALINKEPKGVTGPTPVKSSKPKKSGITLPVIVELLSLAYRQQPAGKSTEQFGKFLRINNHPKELSCNLKLSKCDRIGIIPFRRFQNRD